MDLPLSPEQLELLRDALVEVVYQKPIMDEIEPDEASFVFVERRPVNDWGVIAHRDESPLTALVFIAINVGYGYLIYTHLPVGVFAGTGRMLMGLTRHMLMVNAGTPVLYLSSSVLIL